jgi:hypothetical protein
MKAEPQSDALSYAEVDAKKMRKPNRGTQRTRKSKEPRRLRDDFLCVTQLLCALCVNVF